MANNANLLDLPKLVLGLDDKIEYCAVVDKLGHIVASKVREPPQRVVSKDVEERGALHSAIRNFSVPTWAEQFGEIYYNATRHEKIIGATIRMSKNYLMIVAFDVTTNFDEIIMQRIMPIIKEYKSNRAIDTQT